MTKQKPMTDEEALRYAIETLEEAEVHFTIDDAGVAELHEVRQTLSSILDSYEKCSFGTLTLGGGEENDEA